MAGNVTLAPGITELNPGSGIYGNQSGQETDAQGNVLSQAQINAADAVYRANGGGALSTSNPNLNPYGDTSAQQSAMNDAATNFWSGGGSTTPMSFAGGSLTNNGDGTATFTPTGGTAEQLNQNMSFAQMAALDPSGDLAKQWNQQFGTDFGGSGSSGSASNASGNATANGNPPRPPPAYSASNPDPNMTQDMLTASDDFFGGPAGSTYNIDGGTIADLGGGNATFTPAGGGAAENINTGETFGQIASGDNTGSFAKLWGNQYGLQQGDAAWNTTDYSGPAFGSGSGTTSSASTTNNGQSGNGATSTTVTGTPASAGFDDANQFETSNGVTPNVIGTNSTGSGPTTTSGSVTGGTAPTVNQGTYSITPGTAAAITPGTVAGGAPATMASAQEGVDPNMTVEGNLENYLGAGNPAIEELMQQVGTVAGQNSNAGNVFHSSMENQAVANAMLNVANGDATQDANMYAGVAANNANLLQSAFNTNATLANNFSMAQLSSSTQQAIATLQAQTNLAQTQMSTQQAEAVASLNNSTQVQIAGIDASNSMLIATNQDASQAYNQYLTNVENAMVNTQDPTALNTEISQLTAGIQAQLSAISAVSGVKIPSITTLGAGADQSSGQPGSGQVVQGAQPASGQPQLGTQGPNDTIVVGYDNTGTAVYGRG
jgi:hypothetical protein